MDRLVNFGILAVGISSLAVASRVVFVGQGNCCCTAPPITAISGPAVYDSVMIVPGDTIVIVAGDTIKKLRAGRAEIVSRPGGTAILRTRSSR